MTESVGNNENLNDFGTTIICHFRLSTLTVFTGKFEIYHQWFIFVICSTNINRHNLFFLMSCQVKTSGQCQLPDKKNTNKYYSIVSLQTDSVIVDHAV
jgi:hypothetical protein